MKIAYRLRQLTRREQEYYAMVLSDEIDLQRWYGMAYCPMMAEEMFLTLQ